MIPFFLLGAQDPEMQEIEKLLQSMSLPYAYAKINGNRVHPGNAYSADPVSIPPVYTFVFVECGFRQVIVDHHRPTDPAYKLGPDRFFEASSIGQMVKLLSEVLPHEAMSLDHVPEHLRYVAAIDHCFNAAVKGQCPGISSRQAARVRIQHIAETTGKTTATVRRAVRQWLKRKRDVPIINMGGMPVYDFTKYDCGTAYSVAYLSLQQAAAQEMFACMLRCRHSDNEPEKYHANGLTVEAAEAFMAMAPELGLHDVYGVPARGYAGGYLAPLSR
jgi:hypothetical protein